MNTQTIIISKKKFDELFVLKEKLDSILKSVLPQEKKGIKGSDLLDFAKLKIKGGPKDLSEKMDLYLYN
ncbi:MAG: hypothetical protein V1910_01515 [bacterium]